MARRSPKCDPQREEVYRWEKKIRTLFYGQRMTVKQGQDLLRKMCSRYGVLHPRLKLVRGVPYTGAAWGNYEIEVNADRARPTAVLMAHEAAHAITFAQGIEEPDHGPVWLGVYMDLLDHFKILPLCMTEPSAHKAGLKWRQPE